MSDEGINTQTLVAIVEAGITIIASYMLYERKTVEKIQCLQQQIKDAKHKLENL